ncbi:MAG: GNAT family N-acetyltransferase [Actinomycetota bacterium]
MPQGGLMKVEPVRVGGVTIEEIDLRSLNDEMITKYNTFSNLLRAESNPEDPPIPVEMTIAQLRNIPEFVVVSEHWALNEDGDIVARAQGGFLSTDENNTHLVDAGVAVLPEYRRRGIGKHLLGTIVAFAERENRTLLVAGTSERVPSGDAWCERIGAERGLSQHINRLDLAELDRALVDRWVEEGPGRAPGYSLLWLDEGPYPDDLLDQIVACHNIMNTAPRDDLQIEDFTITAQQVREWEKMSKASGGQRWSIFIRHDASDELVAFTETNYNPRLPKTAWQLATAVRPDHRGHALGKWMKAAMLQRLVAERPELEDVRTGNADSNDAMLGINKQLGFKHYIASTVWQVRVEKVRAYLDSSA